VLIESLERSDTQDRLNASRALFDEYWHYDVELKKTTIAAIEARVRIEPDHGVQVIMAYTLERLGQKPID
jgi:hypothetical protein